MSCCDMPYGTNVGLHTEVRGTLRTIYDIPLGGCCLPYSMCPCCTCLAPRMYAKVQENREESNWPMFCIFDPWRCKCCTTVDNTLVSYFDREPFAPICCGLFSGHFFKERCYWNPLLIFPAAGLYLVTFGLSLFFCPCLSLGFNNVWGVPCDCCLDTFVHPCWGESLLYAPNDNCCCRIFCTCPHRMFIKKGNATAYAGALATAVNAYRARTGVKEKMSLDKGLIQVTTVTMPPAPAQMLMPVTVGGAVVPAVAPTPVAAAVPAPVVVLS